ncbi:GNAT family N-acetyltransferase [Streptomyces roseoverticillatus]|uniref:GNAT family N-acetyltransferase n=1 Tax=Streptomyces roseoverticillatus TaxID=66429 RepID=UPI0027E42576|nr:GNAT family N-acetyltransferase [Streptomyces roseoverticillatus]
MPHAGAIEVRDIGWSGWRHRVTAPLRAGAEAERARERRPTASSGPAAGADSSLYLKELFVRKPARRQGIATALMTHVRRAASTAGCSRAEWTADRDNHSALEFCQALDAEPPAR